MEGQPVSLRALARAIDKHQLHRPTRVFCGASQGIGRAPERFPQEAANTVPANSVEVLAGDNKAGAYCAPSLLTDSIDAADQTPVQPPTTLKDPLKSAPAAKDRLLLQYLPLVAHRKLATALGTPPREHLAPGLRGHTGPKSMCVFPLPKVRLERAFHPASLLTDSATMKQPRTFNLQKMSMRHNPISSQTGKIPLAIPSHELYTH